MSWTPERVELLKKYWAEGLSASRIAYRIGGTTRNAVIGRVRRMGLPFRDTSQRYRPASGRGSTPKVVKVNAAEGARVRRQRLNELKWGSGVQSLFAKEAEPLPPPSETDIARVSFADLEPHHCRFIPGDPKASGKLYCGCDAVPGLPYCEAHAARCFDVAKFDRQRVRPFAGMRENSHDTTRAVDKLLGDREHA